MLAPRPIESDVVLLGAGHAHVEVLRRFAMQPEPGVRLTLISREPETPYSGMLPGLLRGEYTHTQAHIDLAPLASAAGARLILGEATAIDLTGREVTVPGRPAIGFDILSIDIGGIPTVPEGSGVGVKPIGSFIERLEKMRAELPDRARIAVVGGGAAGSELALALAARFAGHFRLALVCASAEPVPAAPVAARRAVRDALTQAEVELACGVTAGSLSNGRLALSDGTFLEASAALWATDVRGPTLLAASGLACDEHGCVQVDATLRSVSHPQVFAAGDCASLAGNPRPKSGVWAVRAGTPLAENLRRAARGKPLTPWRPQRDALAILGLGRGRAVAWRNGMALQGRKVWRLKDWIDRRWMRMYSEFQMAPDPEQAMRCGGCGAKVSAEVLASALTVVDRTDSPDLLQGWDDAAVMSPPLGKLLVQSVDHFRAFLDDPYVFGRIAAAHALSDLYAMGAAPWTALAVAAVPYAEPRKMRADLAAMLQGASEILRGDGCSLVGGHSAEAAEAELGFSVTGLVDSGKLMRKSGLKPGDRLILTKPLGTGLILAANMRAQARAAWLHEALASMQLTNATACRIVVAHRPSAGTDVTGFGLAGHLEEMLRAAGVAAVVRMESIPLLSGARALATHGVESTLGPENRRALEGFGGTDAVLLADPQTSGGLLVGLPAQRADTCLHALHDAGVAAAVIGEVEPERDGGGRIRLE